MQTKQSQDGRDPNRTQARVLGKLGPGPKLTSIQPALPFPGQLKEADDRRELRRLRRWLFLALYGVRNHQAQVLATVAIAVPIYYVTVENQVFQFSIPVVLPSGAKGP